MHRYVVSCVASPILALLGLVALPDPAGAADLVPHAARYRIEVPANANAPKGAPVIAITGSIATEIRRTCTGWDMSWSAAYTIPFSRQRTEQYEEALSSREANDGRTLEYTSRYRVGARTVAAEGQARFGGDKEDGVLVVKPSGLAPDTRLQPGTLPPVALRAWLIGRLVAGERSNLYRPGLEMLRFHRSTDYGFEVLRASAAPAAPAAAAATAAKKPDQPVDRGSLLKTASWPVLQKSYQIAEWAEIGMQLHSNGVISRLNFKREGYDLVGALAELVGSAPPKCD
jgi:hypothetical protein